MILWFVEFFGFLFEIIPIIMFVTAFCSPFPLSGFFNVCIGGVVGGVVGEVDRD